METSITGWWFTIEPYVYIGLTSECVLLYNTLDGEYIESNKVEIIQLLKKLLERNNQGVVYLTNEDIQNRIVESFVDEVREKYMGDIIDIALSNEKPVQILPLFNFLDNEKLEVYKRHNFSVSRNLLENLFEITIHVNNETDICAFLNFLKSVPSKIIFNIYGKLNDVVNNERLLSFLDNSSSLKKVYCLYTEIPCSQTFFMNNFLYCVLVNFPIDIRLWEDVLITLREQNLSYKYIFNVASLNDCQDAEQLIERFRIKEYQIKPIYDGTNMAFFKEYVFLSKKDILSMPISIKNIFANQAINTYDFGKINIMSNGDVFANMNFLPIGNIYKDSAYDIVCKELNEGESWFRVRDKEPCNRCVFQWLCPSPSDYEIAIGLTNLCHVM